MDSTSANVSASSDLGAFVRAEFEEHRAVCEGVQEGLAPSLGSILDLAERSIRSGGKLLLIGNGGSAADAQHIAAELVIRYREDRVPIAAIALTTDSSTLTACGNDLGFDNLFARQVEALGRSGDTLIAISTSGKSANVISALRQARAMKLHTVGFTGADGGNMCELCDALLVVPSRTTARVQEMHIFVAHVLCKALETKLGLV